MKDDCGTPSLTFKEKTIDLLWHNYYSSTAYVIITIGLLGYDSYKILIQLLPWNFLLNPNNVVHFVWPWYITFPLGFAAIFLTMRWIGPPPF